MRPFISIFRFRRIYSVNFRVNSSVSLVECRYSWRKEEEKSSPRAVARLEELNAMIDLQEVTRRRRINAFIQLYHVYLHVSNGNV